MFTTYRGYSERCTKKPTIGADMIGRNVIVRTYSAGVHAGTLKARDGKEVELTGSRRIWRWAGAASLSELAQRGTSSPESCIFPAPVDHILITEAIEVIACTESARASIEGVKAWTA